MTVSRPDRRLRTSRNHARRRSETGLAAFHNRCVLWLVACLDYTAQNLRTLGADSSSSGDDVVEHFPDAQGLQRSMPGHSHSTAAVAQAQAEVRTAGRSLPTDIGFSLIRQRWLAHADVTTHSLN